MKIKSLLAIAVVAALAPVAMADVTINITGATAFRSAASTAIKNSFTSVNYAYNGTSFTGATYQLFVGTYSGIGGTTTIRTNWSGSVEGIRDLSQQNNIGFLPVSTTVSSGGTPSASTSSLDSAKPQLAFSDVYSAATPYDNGTVAGSVAGIIAFRLVANASAPASLTNVTAQQFRAMATTGNQKLSLFTGNSTDTTLVYLTGRNDGSGTRTTVLAETGFGYTNLVKQYKITTSGVAPTNFAIDSLQIWPTNDGANISNIWNTDTAANGGYSSGGGYNTALGATSASTQIKSASGSNIGSPKSVIVLSYLGTNDSVTAATAGAKILSYNGSSLSVNSGGITNPQVIQYGNYTLWANEQLYWQTNTDTGDLGAFRDNLLANIPANLGNAGLDISTMKVSRTSDGGLVSP